MQITNSIEYLYLVLMLRWEKTAPPDKHWGTLDDKKEQNSQITRFAYIIRKIAAGQEDEFYSKLENYTRRKDGNSYISKKSTWMNQPVELGNGWFFEGCTSLEQKHGFIQSFSKLGLSPALCRAIEDFVANKSIEQWLPTEAEANALLAKIQNDDWFEIENSELIK